MLIIAISGLLIVWKELNQITNQNELIKKSINESTKQLEALIKQNELTESSIRHSFRPLGIISGNPTIIVNLSGIPIINDITKFKLTNKGNGVLINIGYLVFWPKEEINFYTKNLINNINEKKIDVKTENIDRLDSEKRLKPVIANDSHDIFILIKPEFDKPINEFYLYYVFLYKDINHNLYDTTYLAFFRYRDENPIVIPNSFFHQYSIEEHNDLYKYFKLLDHPIADYIGSGPIK